MEAPSQTMHQDEYDIYASEIGTIQRLLNGTPKHRAIERNTLEARLHRAQDELRNITADTQHHQAPPLSTMLHLNYHRRIAQLTVYAADEDITVSNQSCRDFWTFIRKYCTSPQAALILTDSGNIVAIWRATHGSVIEVEFHGHSHCQVTTFKNPSTPVRPLPEITREPMHDTGQRIQAESLIPTIRTPHVITPAVADSYAAASPELEGSSHIERITLSAGYHHRDVRRCDACGAAALLRFKHGFGRGRMIAICADCRSPHDSGDSPRTQTTGSRPLSAGTPFIQQLDRLSTIHAFSVDTR